MARPGLMVAIVHFVYCAAVPGMSFRGIAVRPTGSRARLAIDTTLAGSVSPERFRFSCQLTPNALNLTKPSAAKMIPVLIPAALPLFGTGRAIMGFISWRRKRKAEAYSPRFINIDIAVLRGRFSFVSNGPWRAPLKAPRI